MPKTRESAIAKQPAWAAPINCSGFVPAPSSKREPNYYGPLNSPFPKSSVPLPSLIVPSHRACAMRVGIPSISGPRRECRSGPLSVCHSSVAILRSHIEVRRFPVEPRRCRRLFRGHVRLVVADVDGICSHQVKWRPKADELDTSGTAPAPSTTGLRRPSSATSVSMLRTAANREMSFTRARRRADSAVFELASLWNARLRALSCSSAPS